MGNTAAIHSLISELGIYSVKRFGAVGDARQAFDAVATSGSAAITSATAAFKNSDVGKVAVIAKHDGSAVLATTIASVQSATAATLANSLTFSATDCTLTIGTDDTAAIQAALNAAQPYGKVVMPPGTYTLTDTLNISQGVTLEGTGVYICNTTYGVDQNVQNLPTAAPWLQGSVLLQTKAATNAITCTAIASTVNFKDFGIRFVEGIRFKNTGHGIQCNPPALAGASPARADMGLVHFHWENVKCFGHDGAHYAYWLKNVLVGNLDMLHFYGGGGLYIEGDPSGMGNMVVNHLYGQICAPGNGTTASYGIEFHSNGTAAANPLGQAGSVNLCTFIRPQVSFFYNSGTGSTFPEALGEPGSNSTPPQYFTNDTGSQKSCNIVWLHPDFEYGPSSYATAYYPKSGLASAVLAPFDDGTSAMGSYLRDLQIEGHLNASSNDGHYAQQEGNAVMLTAAGASAPSANYPNTYGSDFSGNLTFGTGTSPTAGDLMSITFGRAYMHPPSVTVTPGNKATAALGLYAYSTTTQMFIGCANAPSASQANSTYMVSWQTVGDTRNDYAN